MTDTRTPDPFRRRPTEDAGPGMSGPAGVIARRRTPQSPNEALQPVIPPPPPDEPRRGQNPFVSALSGFLTLLMLLVLAGMVTGGYGVHRLSEPGPLPSDRVIVIAPHQDVSEILGQLQDEGVIDSPLIVNVALLLEGNRSNLKSGEYLFKQNASLQDVIDTLVSGKQVLHTLTIPEGLTSLQIVQRLQDNDLLSGDIREVPKEGSLLPDTYKFERGFSRTALIRKMQEDQRRLLAQIWARRAPDLILRTPADVVTMASIVEKETGKADERPRVARVFLNRLSKHMRLQSDPTIVYGLVGGKATLGRGITRAELQQATPYNTYTIDGLPPGPISNPGRAAMEAVVNPARTNDLYFVADGTGGHAFASSLEEHNRNVGHWRQIERSKAAAGAADDEPDKAPTVDPAPGAAPAASPPAIPALPGLRGAVPAPATSPPRQQRSDLRGPDRRDALHAVAKLDRGAPLGRAFYRFRARGEAHNTTLPGMALAFDEAKPAPFGAIVSPSPEAESTPGEAPAPTNPFGHVVSVPPVANGYPASGAPAPAASAPQPAQTGAATAPKMKAPKGFEETLGLQPKPITPHGKDLLDGPADNPGGDPPDLNTPLSPKMQAELAAAGAEPPVGTGVSPTGRVPMPPINGHVRALDASEGTPLDPLLAKNWDLNSPQTIPPGVR